MSRINMVEAALHEIEGGKFQKLCESYLHLSNRDLKHLYALGSQPGTDKTTIGVPDAHSKDPKGATLVAFTTAATHETQKLKKDVEDCLDERKTGIRTDEIAKIICCHLCWRLKPDQESKIKSLDPRIELIGPKQIAQDLCYDYPALAQDFLSITIGNGTFLTYGQFVAMESRRKFTTPQSHDLRYRSQQLSELENSLSSSQVTIIQGHSGCGKTKLALEGSYKFCNKNKLELLILESRSGANTDSDINEFLTHTTNTVLLVDDANEFTSLKFLLEIALKNPQLKLVLTVRDYAAPEVKKLTDNSCGCNALNLDPLKDKQIETLLKEDYGIKNENYLDQIAKISQGNVRLAIMAGTIAKRDGYTSIQNAYDIMSNYFSATLENLPPKTPEILSFLSIEEVCDLEEGHAAYDYLMSKNYSSEQVRQAAQRLSERAILDYRTLGTKTAVSFEQQNLRDFLIYKLFFKSRSIDLTEFITTNVYSNPRIVSTTIQRILGVFDSHKTRKYIEECVKLSWVEAQSAHSSKDQAAFMQIFHAILGDYSLEYAQSHIDSNAKSNWGFHTRKDSNSTNTSLTLEILATRKNTNSFDRALPILLSCIESGTETAEEYIGAVKKSLNFSELSVSTGFRDEIRLIAELKNLYLQNPSVNIARMLLELCKQYFQSRPTITISTTSSSISFRNYDFSENQSYLDLRRLCLSAACSLIGNDNFRHETLMLLHESLTTSSTPIIDLDIIASEFPSQILNLSAEDRLICFSIYKSCSENHVDANTLMNIRYSPFDNILSLTLKGTFYRLPDNEILKITKSWDLDRYSAFFKEENKFLTSTSFTFEFVALTFHVIKILTTTENCTKAKILDVIATLVTEITDPEKLLSPHLFFEIKTICDHASIRDKLKSVSASPVIMSRLDSCLTIDEMKPQLCNEIILHLSSDSFPLTCEQLIALEQLKPHFIAEYCSAILAIEQVQSPVFQRFFQELDNDDDQQLTHKILSLGFLPSIGTIERPFLEAADNQIADSSGNIFRFLCENDERFISRFIDAHIPNLQNWSPHNPLRRILHLYKFSKEMMFQALLLVSDKTKNLGFSFFLYTILEGNNEGANLLSIINDYADYFKDAPQMLSGLAHILSELNDTDREAIILKIYRYDPEGKTLPDISPRTLSASSFGNQGFIPVYESQIKTAERIRQQLPNTPQYLKHRTFIENQISQLKGEIEQERWRIFHSVL